jgi:hypothetical protein
VTTPTAAPPTCSPNDYLNYPQALKHGGPIATGVIEGACRHLVKDRLDLTGARWGLNGAETILKLRALRSNADFNQYWKFHLNNERHRVHQARYANEVASQYQLDHGADSDGDSAGARVGLVSRVHRLIDSGCAHRDLERMVALQHDGTIGRVLRHGKRHIPDPVAGHGSGKFKHDPVKSGRVLCGHAGEQSARPRVAAKRVGGHEHLIC